MERSALPILGGEATTNVQSFMDCPEPEVDVELVWSLRRVAKSELMYYITSYIM